MGKGKNIAYVRVSTVEQNEARQRDALEKFEIDKWFIEKASGKDTKELKDSLERIRSASDEMITAIDQSLQKQASREKHKSRDEGR